MLALDRTNSTLAAAVLGLIIMSGVIAGQSGVFLSAALCGCVAGTFSAYNAGRGITGGLLAVVSFILALLLWGDLTNPSREPVQPWQGVRADCVAEVGEFGPGAVSACVNMTIAEQQ